MSLPNHSFAENINIPQKDLEELKRFAKDMGIDYDAIGKSNSPIEKKLDLILSKLVELQEQINSLKRNP